VGLGSTLGAPAAAAPLAPGPAPGSDDPLTAGDPCSQPGAVTIPAAIEPALTASNPTVTAEATSALRRLLPRPGDELPDGDGELDR